MAGLSPSSWGAGAASGLPSTGGTITGPLVINNAVASGTTENSLDILDPTHADAECFVQVTAASATSANVTVTVAPHGDGAAGLTINDDNFDGDAVFACTSSYIHPRSTATSSAATFLVGRSGAGQFQVKPAGWFSTSAHAAPADADIATGECALWFDQTNGAANLMVKAKQANGVVVTASVALA